MTEEALAQSGGPCSRSVIDARCPCVCSGKTAICNYLGCNPAFARDAGMTYPHEVVGKERLSRWAGLLQAELYRRR